MRFVAILVVMLLCGCSSTQVRQEFLGYSMDDVRNCRTKHTLEFNMSASDCILKIKDVLQSMEAIAREDENNQYIVADNFQRVFRSTIDTTQVGILVTSDAEGRCRVEVASGNESLATFVAGEMAAKIGPKT